MIIPDPTYVKDADGNPLVQLSAEKWETFINEVQHLQQKVAFQQKLERAFSEVKQISQRKRPVTTLDDFLNEL